MYWEGLIIFEVPSPDVSCEIEEKILNIYDSNNNYEIIIFLIKSTLAMLGHDKKVKNYGQSRC